MSGRLRTAVPGARGQRRSCGSKFGRFARPIPEIQLKSLPCRIERLQLARDDVMAVFLRIPAHETFHFVAGQYLDIMLPQNRRRSFSIASAPDASRPDRAARAPRRER